jgi:hypothetical protein
MQPMKFLVTLLLALATSMVPFCQAQEAADAELIKKANDIQKRILPFDRHLDLPFDCPGAGEHGKTQFDLTKAARGGLKGVWRHGRENIF